MTSMNLFLSYFRDKAASSSVLATRWVAEELVVRVDATNAPWRALDGGSSISKESLSSSPVGPDLPDISILAG